MELVRIQRLERSQAGVAVLYLLLEDRKTSTVLLTEGESRKHCWEKGNMTDFYVLVHNVAKRANIGNMLRSAAAFSVKEVIVVGNKRKVQLFGSQGTHKHVQLRFFDSLKESINYLKTEKHCTIYGVEIMDEAVSVVQRPFEGNSAFVLGNEGDGLSETQKGVCDKFVYIPHYGNGTASLNVTVAASIVFHHFAVWAKYAERPRVGEKFLVEDAPQKRGAETSEDLALQQMRQLRREHLKATADNVQGLFES